MLADKVDHIIGVDTHKDSHTIALVSPAGAATAHRTVPANPIGYLCGYRFAVEQAPGRRVWAIEGTGSYGAGLTAYLLEQGEWVVEIDRPARPARRNGAKTDDLDAVRAAREALGRDHLAQPRRRGEREAIRVLLTTRHSAMGARTCAINHLKALVVNAPQRLREQLRALPTDQLLAQRALALQAEADELHDELDTLVSRLAPRLLTEPGVGVICAAQLLTAWSQAGRLRSEAAFAMLGGAAPVEASSGKVVRHRLNRSGDRQLNRALHTIVMSRMTCDAETRAYVTRRTAEGKTPREIKRCLKRYLARRLFKLLETSPAPIPNTQIATT